MTVAANAHAGSLANTATVATSGITVDPDTGNNSATDTDAIVLPLPAIAVLDNFNRANANTLGANWSQVTLGGQAAIRTSQPGDGGPRRLGDVERRGNTIRGQARARRSRSRTAPVASRRPRHAL